MISAPAGSSSISPVTVTSKKPQAADLDPSTPVCHSGPVIGSLFPKKAARPAAKWPTGATTTRTSPRIFSAR